MLPSTSSILIFAILHLRDAPPKTSSLVLILLDRNPTLFLSLIPSPLASFPCSSCPHHHNALASLVLPPRSPPTGPTLRCGADRH